MLFGQFTFNIINTGKKDLNWTITKDADWIYASPASGVNEEEIIVNYDLNEDIINSREGKLTISAADAQNSPVTVIVRQKKNHSSVFEINKDLSILVFPNPTAGFVNIKSTSEIHSETIVRIIAQNGRVVFEKQVIGNIDLKIDLSSFSSGPYFIEMKNEVWNIFEKIIVHK